MVERPRRPPRGRRRGPRLRLRQRAPASRGRARPLPDRPRAGDQRATSPPSSPRPGRSRRCTGSATARAAGCRRPSAAATELDPDLPVIHVDHAAPASRAGRASGCRPSSSGRPPPPAPTPIAQPRQARVRRAPAGAYADGRRCGAVQMLGDVWEWTVVGARRATRASRPSPTPSTPRSSSAPATRSCAAAPGRRAAT